MDLSAVISYVVGAGSFVFGVYQRRKAAKLQAERDALQKKSVELQEENTALQRRSTEIQHRSTQLQYFAELRAWAGKAVDMFSDAVHLRGGDRRVFNSPDFLRRKRRLLRRLSAHLDRGRWFFPNVSREPQGPEKEAKFGGFRHEIVHTLHRAYRVVRSMDFTCPEDNRVQCHDLRELQRYFVQQIQEVLNPANFDAEFRQIVSPRGEASWRPREEPPKLSRGYDYLDEDITPPLSGAGVDERVSVSRVVEDVDERIYGDSAVFRVVEDVDERIYGDSLGFGPPQGADPFAGGADRPPAGHPPTTPPKG